MMSPPVLRDDELLIERTFDAPLALVWRLWESPEHMIRWWGPEKFTATSVDWMLAPGKPWRITMVSNQWGVSSMGGVVLEIEHHRRIVFSFAWTEESGRDLDAVVTVTFEENDEKTRHLPPDAVLIGEGSRQPRGRLDLARQQTTDVRRESGIRGEKGSARMITLTTYKWVPEFVAPLVRAFRVRWALEEAGIPYDVRHVALGPEQRAPEHLARQPFGQVPAIDDDGLVMFESGAIALHIAEKSESLLPRDSAARDRAISWLFAALNSVETAVQRLGELDFFHADAAWAKEYRPKVEAFTRDRLAMLAKALGDQDYLEGRFTVGDLMMVDVLRILDHTTLLDDYPTLKAYKQRGEARPAFQRAMKAQLAGFAGAA